MKRIIYLNLLALTYACGDTATTGTQRKAPTAQTPPSSQDGKNGDSQGQDPNPPSGPGETPNAPDTLTPSSGTNTAACSPISGKSFCLIDETLLQEGINHQATHNAQGQKAVQNQNGIFVSYASQVYADPLPDSTSNWVVARSTDGGKTFAKVFETSMHRILPSSIQSDEDGNIYAIHGTGTEWLGGLLDKHPKDAWFYKFEKGKNFADPTITKVPNASTDKSDFVYDSTNKNFYYMTFNDTFAPVQNIPSFFAIDKSGQIQYQTSVGKNLDPINSKYAKIMYPHLRTDGKRVFMAWSTEYDPPGASNPDDPNQTNLYRNASFLISEDGGRNFRNLAGSAVKFPIVGDETGPATLITSPDEIGDHNWLGGINYVGGKLFAAHQIWGVKNKNSSHPHLSVFDIDGKKRDVDVRAWTGSTFSPDGTGKFVVNPSNPNSPVYYVAGGSAEGKPTVVILISEDKGNTWKDYAAGTYKDGDPVAVSNVSVSPTVTPDGNIVGVFTRCVPRPEIGRCESYMNNNYILDSKVFFFKVKAKL